MKIKKCVGAIIYFENKIFLMTSPKWKAWIIPGGKIEESETEEQALKREIKEELGIKISNIEKVGTKIKFPSPDFKEKDVKFIFIDFFAKALSTQIKPNKEIKEYGWFTLKEALNLPLIDSTKQLIEQFKEVKYKN